MNTNIKNKNGDISVYGFACGYVQWASLTGEEIDHWDNGKRMYHEGATYHVKHFKNGERVKWESFDKLGEARNFYNRIRIN